MIDCVIFSRDRPMQLDACLRSLAENTTGVQTPWVLVQATNPEYARGYEEVEATRDAHFITEGSFARQVRDILACSLEQILLLCDDSITYRPVDARDLCIPNEAICLSLRLGWNTVYCHPLDREQSVPSLASRDGYQLWAWPLADGDFSYPYSVDGQIHRAAGLRAWLDDGSFVNPNTMEDRIVNMVGKRADVPQLMASFSHSVQVGIPNNVVTQTHGNRHAGGDENEPALLNERFLAGERIRYEEMDFSDVRGCHQEIPYVIR